MPAPEALTSDAAASASSPTSVLPASYFVRDSEQITASEALLVLQEGPRASQSSMLAETIPETQDIPQTPDVTQPSDFSQDFEVIIPRRTATADRRPYPRLVDPTAVTLPLHSTPMDEASSVQGSPHVSLYLENYHIQLDKHSPLRPPEVYTCIT